MNPIITKRLLVVSDAPERWHSAFNLNGVVITNATSAKETARACQQPHDLAIVAVETNQLTDILTTVRNSCAHRSIPILVENEAAPHAGLLPRLRAMPCHSADLLRLAHRLLAPDALPMQVRTQRAIF